MTATDLDVLDIATAWSYWTKPIPDSTPRDVALPESLQESLCLVIQGVRRCGKSTLLRQLVSRYRLDPTRCAFLNLEDPRLSNAQTYETLDLLVRQFRQRHGDTGQLFFFLDEIQGAKGWQRWLRAQLDQRNGNCFVITGSNATLLSGELSSTLTGRHLTVELFPFSLQELRRHQPHADLADYLVWGGFPEPLALSDGDLLRRQYFHDIVERDIRERIRARSSVPIRQVAQMAFESAGSEISTRRLAAATGVAVETAGSYIDACESAYLLFGCQFFSYSARKRASRNRKFYPVDPGLRRVVASRTGEDRGKALECATYIALRRQYETVYYWRAHGEVDFVVQHNGRVVPVQVTWDERRERHDLALDEFYEQHPQANEAVFVTAKCFDEAQSMIADSLGA